jgi:hypothetical protein
MTDPLRPYYGHPILPAGFNADDNNGDEVDGAGTNWAIWPLLFDTFEGLKAIIVTDDMLSLFDETCADYTVSAQNNLVVLMAENQEAVVRNLWGELVLAGQDNVIVFPAGPRETRIRPELDTARPSQGDQTHTVRRKA